MGNLGSASFLHRVKMRRAASDWSVLLSRQDQQANEELARIMGEFTEEAEPSQGPSDKGADLLAMMDGL